MTYGDNDQIMFILLKAELKDLENYVFIIDLGIEARDSDKFLVAEHYFKKAQDFASSTWGPYNLMEANALLYLSDLYKLQGRSNEAYFSQLLYDRIAN